MSWSYDTPTAHAQYAPPSFWKLTATSETTLWENRNSSMPRDRKRITDRGVPLPILSLAAAVVSNDGRTVRFVDWPSNWLSITSAPTLKPGMSALWLAGIGLWGS
ncbi:uncharacterized protein LOC130428296 isoform X2 [Triplophysa dalaica]|uniref:uncharacterized protein LOC130428296 isoform X2 n=1 Tax=Triplophysa dalaica TaxID=1582913 RepID=UPI0024DF9E59|nr:uncharacterized protein LOC130428296 isoform X2 [Triplophysa dalaica]